MISNIDKYGIKEYKLWFKTLLAFSILYIYISIMAYPLYLAEHLTGNVKSYGDAFYLLQMTCSTIGFGDYYPVSTIGRWIVVSSFYVGVGLAGYIGSTIIEALSSKTDNSVLNRELRKQNEEILKLLKENNERRFSGKNY